MLWLKCLLFTSVLVVCTEITSANIYCLNHTYGASANTSYMQFTKEVIEQEYVREYKFKDLHCCAKGYRSIEWLKDGKSYPWSSEDTSSLILYPEAENQTIYTRKASKTDEGRYTCVLRNATHKMEHHIVLKLKSSSPDIPLATFKPVDQFANIGSSARFYCEAFIGKKALANISISIRWYHLNADNKIQEINDNESIKEEVINREDEETIGSYLTITHATLNHYGRYLCRIEIAKSDKHRLDMSASLVNALPIEANAKSIFKNPIFLGSCAAIISLIMFFLFFYFTKKWWLEYVTGNLKKKEDIENKELSALACRKHSKSINDSSRQLNTKYDDTKIKIERS